MTVDNGVGTFLYGTQTPYPRSYPTPPTLPHYLITSHSTVLPSLAFQPCASISVHLSAFFAFHNVMQRVSCCLSWSPEEIAVPEPVPVVEKVRSRSKIAVTTRTSSRRQTKVGTTFCSGCWSAGPRGGRNSVIWSPTSTHQAAILAFQNQK